MKQNYLKDYLLVWNDEFENVKLDMSKWNLKAEMSPQNDLQLRDDETAIKIKDGILVLTSDRLDKKTYYTNTSLTTYNRMSFQYGYLEIKAKVPFGKPAWPSFWMLSDPNYRDADTNWKSEVDIFEVFGSETSLEANIHKWYDDGRHVAFPEKLTTRKIFKDKADAETWHTYGLLWTAESFKYLVDGEVFQIMDITSNGNFTDDDSGMSGYHEPHYVIFNNYVYTKSYKGCETWAKGKEATVNDTFPINYDIDYIRLYQIPGNGKLIIY